MLLVRIKKASDFFDIDFEQLQGIGFIRVNCDVNKLIESIIISPWADEKYYNEVLLILKEKNINCKIKKSYFTVFCNVDEIPINSK